MSICRSFEIKPHIQDIWIWELKVYENNLNYFLHIHEMSEDMHHFTIFFSALGKSSIQSKLITVENILGNLMFFFGFKFEFRINVIIQFKRSSKIFNILNPRSLKRNT